MATDVSEFEAFADFARERLEEESGASLEDCLHAWREKQRKSEEVAKVESLYERMRRAGLIGCIEDGPSDLSTNPKYMEGFGEL